MSKYLYGFKNIETGEFKPSYKTIQGTAKTACFRTQLNAEKLLKIQKDRESYFVCEMAVSEGKQ